MKAMILTACLGMGVGVSFPSLAEPTVSYEVAFEQLYFDQPVFLTYASDDSEQLFVVEQGGLIKTFPNIPSVDDAAVFFNIIKSTKNRFVSGGEEGLLGLAFDPDFINNGHFYVNYSARSPRRTVISQFSVQENNTLVADVDSERILLEIPQDYSNHNGGMITFGPDGYLYIGMGDGGSAGDPKNRAQNGQNLLGKMLRVDTDGNAPSDNPYLKTKFIRDEIWAMGLRNPWRFSFDRITGDLWLGDVGQDEWEEIDIIEKGRNYGWKLMEGTHNYDKGEHQFCTSLTPPVFEYSHNEGRSVTGGYVYRGALQPSLEGWYFFGDFVSGSMWALNADNHDLSIELPEFSNPSSFGEDQNGELYIVSYQGQIYRIVDH